MTDRYPTNLPIIEQTSSRAEVLSGPERRRRWTFEQKARVVAESLVAGAVAHDVARRHGIHPVGAAFHQAVGVS
jgi:transposase